MAPATPSSHVADPALAPFLQPQFDPADYLNASLPSLSLSTASSRPLKQGQSVPLAELSTQTQDLLSQLNTHTTRLSTILTQLTDDILRSGARLAYEVEVLRGETTGLTETLTDGLKPQIEKFIPGGLKLEQEQEPKADGEDAPSTPTQDPASKPSDPTDQTSAQEKELTPSGDPDYITHLRVLTLVRTRLDTVIRVFGEAMQWQLPPSEISLTSSLISVSGPDNTTSGSPSTLEQKGKDFAAALRTEIADLIVGPGDAEGAGGAEAAQTRIQALRELAVVWKGTAEEKARIKFVESLAKLAEDKAKEVERERERRGRGAVGRAASVKTQPAAQAPSVAQKSSGGFLDNLQRLRESYI